MKPCLLLILPHPSLCEPCLCWKIVQIARNPARVREGREGVCKNMKMKMRRSWLFLTSSTSWPLSSFSILIYQLFANSLWHVHREDAQDMDGWIYGWMDGWTDTSRHATYRLLSILPLIQFFSTNMDPLSFITPFNPDSWWESVV